MALLERGKKEDVDTEYIQESIRGPIVILLITVNVRMYF